MRRTRTLALTATTALLAASLIVAPAVPAQAVTAGTVTFEHTGAPQTWTVPAGVTSIDVVLAGAAGAGLHPDSTTNPRGLGGRVSASLPVTPGSALVIVVGGGGDGPSGGFNGGASGNAFGGGGASDVRQGGSGLADRVLVAGGGGGASSTWCPGDGAGPLPPAAGGAGGGLTGGPGGDACAAGTGGGGGTQSAGGVNPADAARSGSLGQGGSGSGPGGGGGGGYFGGAGASVGGGGGGGSGHGPAGTTFRSGINDGDGFASITYGASSQELSVSRAGGGSGTVTSTPAGIACGADCSEFFADGTEVSLAVSPGPGSVFTGWGGACTGTGGCTVTMDQARSVSASFEPVPVPGVAGLTVTRTGEGSGSVSSDPAGIACGADCVQEYEAGTPVSLTATPDSGSEFAGWSGACTGTGGCTVTMDQPRSVSAAFEPVPAPGEVRLSVTRTGQGSVSSDPAGIECGTDCTEDYEAGTVVSLNATPAAGSSFAGWGGACAGANNCVVTMDQARSVTATFEPVAVAALDLSDVRVSPHRFHRRGNPTRPELEWTLGGAADLRINVRRLCHGDPCGTRIRVDHPADAGPGSWALRRDLAPRKLRPGRYRVVVVAATDTDRDREVTGFRVRRG